LLEELPLAEPLPLALPELLGLLGELDGELLPPAALPLFALVSELEPAPALSRLHAAIPTASAKAVITAVKVFIFMHLLRKGTGTTPLTAAKEMPTVRHGNCESSGGGAFRALSLVFL